MQNTSTQFSSAVMHVCSSIHHIAGLFFLLSEFRRHFKIRYNSFGVFQLLVGNFGLSLEQSKAQMSVWAILAAPLIMSVDLKNIRPEQRELLLNEDVIQINQDPLGKQGTLVLEKHNISIWVRELTSLVDNHAPYAIAFVSHRTDGYPYRITIKPSKLGLRHSNGYFLKDVFEKVERPITKPQEDIVVRVKPSGAVLLRAEPMVESNSV